jgi:hypothetical protein
MHSAHLPIGQPEEDASPLPPWTFDGSPAVPGVLPAAFQESYSKACRSCSSIEIGPGWDVSLPHH